MFRAAALALTALLWLTPQVSQAQTAEQRGHPARIERPPPRPSELRAPFAPSLGARIRLEALQLSLTELAQREKKRFLPGSLQLVFSAAFATAAIFVDDPGLRSAFSLTSAVSGARGIVQLSMHANVAKATGDFALIRVTNKGALFRKLHVGELALQRAARVGRRQRIIEGCLGVIASAAYVPVQFLFARREDGQSQFGTAGDYVGLSLSLIGMASSLVQAIMKSPAELHYRGYRSLRATAMLMPN